MGSVCANGVFRSKHVSDRHAILGDSSSGLEEFQRLGTKHLCDWNNNHKMVSLREPLLLLPRLLLIMKVHGGARKQFLKHLEGQCGCGDTMQRVPESLHNKRNVGWA
jgi:hypothetical protein